MAQFYSDSLRIMRLALGRRNENDPDSSDSTLLQYISDAVSLTMTDDVHVFEQFGTLEFNIDENTTTGVYTFSDIGLGVNSINISNEAFITLTDPPNQSVSWNRLAVYYDPGIFYDIWGVNNEDVLIRGYPTEMLYYNAQFVFRTLPNTEYTITLYTYNILDEVSSSSEEISQDYWMRYIAYLAAYNYAMDFRYSQEELARIQKGYQRERKLLLTRTHNQNKMGRAQPQF